MKPALLYLFLVFLAVGACQKKEVNPEGCPFVVKTKDITYTYRFDTQGRIIHLTFNSSINDLDYSYAYQGRQATIDITYPRPGADWLRFHYDVTLSEQGYLLTAQETVYNRLADGTTQERLTASHTCTYDNEGYLMTHRQESFSYPFNQPRVVDTYDEQLSYQDGNPVSISFSRQEHGVAPVSGKITGQYGAERNPLPVPFLLEANSPGFSPNDALKPLLGKPSHSLITAQTIVSTYTTTFAYVYTFDAGKQLNRVVYASGTTPAIIYTLDNGCP